MGDNVGRVIGSPGGTDVSCRGWAIAGWPRPTVDVAPAAWVPIAGQEAR